MAEWEFDKNRESFLAYMLIKAITALPKVKEREFFRMRKPDEGPRPYDIHFTVDGMELPLEKAFEELEKQMDEMIKRKAVSLLDERLGSDLDDRVEVLTDLVKQAADQLRDQLQDKLGIVLSDDESWHEQINDE